MLRVMRKSAGSWFIKFILGAIVVVFVFWGVGSFRSQRANRVAMVNGEIITVEEYRETYNSLIEQYRRSFGNNLSEEMIQMLQVKKVALDQLIDKNLLLGEAARLDFRVSDQELTEAISAMAAFQSGGVFNPRIYQRLLAANRLTPEKFETMQRETMLVDHLQALVVSMVKVSEAEAREWYDWENASVRFDYILLDPGGYEDVQPSDEEVKAYFEANTEAYKTAPLRKVRYIHFDPALYAEQVEVSEEEIQTYYDGHPEELKTPKTVEARHILLKTEPQDDDASIEKVRQRTLTILEKARAGEDFAELAKQFSEGPSKDQGGYLGSFGREAMVKPFADKAFAMAAGEISDPVKTQFGWHIIKVENVNPAITPALEAVRGKIAAQLTDDRTRALAYDEAEFVFENVFDGEDLTRLARDRQLQIQDTDLFSDQGPETGVENRKAFATAAFALEASGISDVQDLGDGYYILHLVSRQPARVPELSEVKEKVAQDCAAAQRDEKARQASEELLADLTKDGDMAAAAAERDLEMVTTGWFMRTEAIPDIGYEREIAAAIFTLSNENPLPSKIFKGRDGYYVVRFKERRPPEAEGFAGAQEEIFDRLIQQKKRSVFESLKAQLRASSDITFEKRFVE